MDTILEVTLGLDRSYSGEPDDLLDVWYVSLVESLYDEAVDDYKPHRTLAGGVFYLFDPDAWLLRGERPFDVADAHSGDTAYYFEHVYDVDGELLEDVVDHFQVPATPALFVHDLRVPEAHRRQGSHRLWSPRRSSRSTRWRCSRIQVRRQRPPMMTSASGS